MRTMTLVAVALMAAAAGCSDPAGPTPDAATPVVTGPSFAKKDFGSGGGGGNTCTIESARQNPVCGYVLLGLGTSVGLSGAACVSGSAASCAAAWSIFVQGGNTYRNTEDTWWEEAWEGSDMGGQGWPAGTGGTYPMPLGGF